MGAEIYYLGFIIQWLYTSLCLYNLFFSNSNHQNCPTFQQKKAMQLDVRTVSQNILKCLGLAPEKLLSILSFLSYCIFVLWQEEEISCKNWKWVKSCALSGISKIPEKMMWSLLEFIKEWVMEESYISPLRVGTHLSQPVLTALVNVHVCDVHKGGTDQRSFVLWTAANNYKGIDEFSLVSACLLNAQVNAWHMWIYLHVGYPWYLNKNIKSCCLWKESRPSPLSHIILHEGDFTTKNVPPNTEGWFEHCGEHYKFYQRLCSNLIPDSRFWQRNWDQVQCTEVRWLFKGHVHTWFFPLNHMLFSDHLFTYKQRWKEINIKTE